MPTDGGDQTGKERRQQAECLVAVITALGKNVDEMSEAEILDIYYRLIAPNLTDERCRSRMMN